MNIEISSRDTFTFSWTEYKCPECGFTETQTRAGYELFSARFKDGTVEGLGRMCPACLIRWIKDNCPAPQMVEVPDA